LLNVHAQLANEMGLKKLLQASMMHEFPSNDCSVAALLVVVA
jgi:hypothetical protein